jgi:HEPN domain-containing protein
MCWIVKAGYDLETARIEMVLPSADFDSVAFLCHRASLKFLKALMSKFGMKYEPSKSLVYLVEKIAENFRTPHDVLLSASKLDPYQVHRKFPTESTRFSTAQISEIVACAECLRAFTIKSFRSFSERK